MPQNPQHYGSLTYVDYSDEKSSFQFNFGAITAISLPGFLTQFGAFRNATNAITLGELVSDQWVGDQTKYNNAPPTNVNAQRERKFLVTYEDVTTFALYRLEIPTADLTGRMIPDTDLVDLTNTQIAAWITAFEAMCKSPEGNDVNVVRIQAVGRNI